MGPACPAEPGSASPGSPGSASPCSPGAASPGLPGAASPGLPGSASQDSPRSASPSSPSSGLPGAASAGAPTEGGSGARPKVSFVAQDRLRLEVEAQKQKVREAIAERGAEVDDASSGIASVVFPEWLVRRADFQYVFPRFAERELDEISLVAFAMSKDPKERTSFDVDKTVAFLSRVPCLASLPSALCRLLCKSVRVSRRRHGAQLFAEGDHASQFFVVLEGLVEELDKEGDVILAVGPGGAVARNALSGSVDTTHEHAAVCVAVPRAGEAGTRRGSIKLPHRELAGAGAGAGAGVGGAPPPPHADDAAVVLLDLGAQDYRATCKLFFQAQNQQLSRFLLSQVALFASWSKHRVNQVAPLMSRRAFRKGEAVFQIGDPARELLVLLSGSCDVQRDVTKARTNRWPSKIETVLVPTPRGTHSEARKLLEHDTRLTRATKSVLLGELQPGDYLGEECVIGYDVRRTTVVARGPVEVLVLAVERTVGMFPSRIIEELRHKHHALFTSDDAIFEKVERDHVVEQQYKHLKRASMGHEYLRRLEESERKVRDEQRRRDDEGHRRRQRARQPQRQQRQQQLLLQQRQQQQQQQQLDAQTADQKRLEVSSSAPQLTRPASTPSTPSIRSTQSTQSTQSTASPLGVESKGGRARAHILPPLAVAIAG
jgi:CRP-like cAMP-binding protein